jgi:hypothetical protein
MNLVDFLVYLIIWGLVLYLLWWGLGRIAPPEPFNKVATVILVVITIAVIVGPLLGYVNVPHLTFHL